MTIGPEDPLRARATHSGPADGWRGARLGAEARDRARREARRIEAAVDIGEPSTPLVTLAFLALALAVTGWEFATWGTSPNASELSRAGGSGIGAIATGSWWKLLTANLLHGNLLHVAMNTFVIYLTGRWLEHLAGRAVVLATVLWAALLSSVGALVVDVAAVTIGASGVAFGLVGCAIAVDPHARTATGVIARPLAVVNVVATFLVPGISIGGHLGGLAAGLMVGAIAWDRVASPERPAGRPRRLLAATIVGLALPPVMLLALGPAVVPGDARALRGELVAPLLERQLAGAQLTDGRRIDAAECAPTDEPELYRCDVDGDAVVVRFSSRDDQWSLRRSE